MGRNELIELAASFPLAKAKLRRAAITLALRRMIVSIAEEIRETERKAELGALRRLDPTTSCVTRPTPSAQPRRHNPELTRPRRTITWPLHDHYMTVT